MISSSNHVYQICQGTFSPHSGTADLHIYLYFLQQKENTFFTLTLIIHLNQLYPILGKMIINNHSRECFLCTAMLYICCCFEFHILNLFLSLGIYKCCFTSGSGTWQINFVSSRFILIRPKVLCSNSFSTPVLQPLRLARWSFRLGKKQQM